MAYIVTQNIIDTKDNGRFYEKGETYPRADLDVSDKRLKELVDRGVIALAEGEETPKKSARTKKAVDEQEG